MARETPDGPAWTSHPGTDEIDPTLYSGGAGIVITLLEAHHHFGEHRYADAAVRAARAIAADVPRWELSSLYFGLSGMAVALRAVAEQLNNVAAEQAARRALGRFRVFFDGERWGPQFDLLGGNAGIALGALRAGDVELAEHALTPYLRTADVTSHGITWENRTGLAARRHHLAHGTLGVAYARATIDGAGVRWHNHEHRVAPSTLEPRSGWAMGNAGIVRELLRCARIQAGGDSRYTVPWPDHPQVTS
jgi:hypothetical protein